MGCLVVQNFLGGRDEDFLGNDGAPHLVESLALIEAILSGEEPAYIDLIVALVKAGKGLRQIIDTIQVASAQVILETGEPNNFSMAQHSYEYCNNVRWFFDTFEHPHRLKLLFVAAAFVTRASTTSGIRRTTARTRSPRRRAPTPCRRSRCSASSTRRSSPCGRARR
jgi:hypothetical protein